ncbi:unnamed protein product (macronuclear) [Paramecium tetraurelia]|uniref:Uncharacterized protein n=1 Tax=Paramecium tetraurelia TaxID=5888 RepID=A0D338_PARTE|nr:uncharacterized protein GSPATT00012940001 [Paramecium tetraurelia]CAK77455.1 unnamed protein product [Paramecium tetraurelia]|eukprot:XP_001444852.1 hypothetical protein (macronuclear) [Paramecium tetraurelia strain d4-2]
MRTLILTVLICFGASQMLRGTPKALIEEEQAIFEAEQEDQSFYVGRDDVSAETLQGDQNQEVEASLAVFKSDDTPMVYVEESTDSTQLDGVEQQESLKIEKIEDQVQAEDLQEATTESANYVDKAISLEGDTEAEPIQNSSTDVVLNIAPKTESLSSSESTKKHVYVYNPLAKKPFVGIKFPPMPVTKDRNYLSNSDTLTIKLPPWSEQSNHRVEDDLEFFQFIRPSDVSVNEY